jgi:hypothetical protein
MLTDHKPGQTLGEAIKPEKIAQQQNKTMTQAQQLQLPQSPEVLAGAQGEPPSYVNSKQFHRILKRRSARDRLEESLRLASKGRKPSRMESLHNNAMRRPRGPGARFLTADEVKDIEDMSLRSPSQKKFSLHGFDSGGHLSPDSPAQFSMSSSSTSTPKPAFQENQFLGETQVYGAGQSPKEHTWADKNYPDPLAPPLPRIMKRFLNESDPRQKNLLRKRRSSSFGKEDLPIINNGKLEKPSNLESPEHLAWYEPDRDWHFN